MSRKHRSRGSRWLVIASSMSLLLSSVGLIAAPAFATESPGGNNGTVKVHEGATEVEPIVANDPKVCTFHLHFFFGDDVQSGDWWVESWAPSDDGAVVLSGTYDATGGEARQPANGGTYTLPDGHYKLFWEGAANPGDVVNIKHKVFWVACAPDPTPSPREDKDDAALNIRKVDEQGNRLAGAVFTVEGMEGTFTTGANGHFCITGLPDDSLWLVTEIEAPEGYEIADEPSQMVEVDDDGDCQSPDAVFVNTLAEVEPSEEPTPSQKPTPSEEPNQGNPTATPREDTAGGNPTPRPGGGTLPDTGMPVGDAATTAPVLLGLLALASVGLLAGLRLAEARTRR